MAMVGPLRLPGCRAPPTRRVSSADSLSSNDLKIGSTETAGLADNRFARTHPADPAPAPMPKCGHRYTSVQYRVGSPTTEESDQVADETVVVVTGASRGAGAGIARALGSHGCIVYVTGRTRNGSEAKHSGLSGTIDETAQAVTDAGGRGIAVRVDHGHDAQVKAFFDQVGREQGRVDILVNNAALIRDEMMARTKFWEEPLEVIDTLDVGLRSSYVATVYAAPLMLPQRRGLVVFTSSSGAVHYAFGPAYGVPKAGTDKMAADMAVDFREFGIATASIWMGSLLTERVRNIIAGNPEKFGHILQTAETPELTGHVIWALHQDPKLMDVSGQTLIGAELALDYGIKDDEDRQPPSFRDLFGVHPHRQYPHTMR
jgi:NAD(P)-dependent dehydrogenase (short-subunit alcohol dehydrogenase family)